MEKVDFKKLNKELYAPKREPSVITVPDMNFIMVDGHGDPNDVDGEYYKAVALLYALTFTIKMGLVKGSDEDSFFDYVVPPLEGLWWLEDLSDMDFTKKDNYFWTSMIRQPDFITPELFAKAQDMVKAKHPELEVSKARLETFAEGLCVQCMHYGPYDLEPATLAKMEEFIENNGLINNIGTEMPNHKLRRHHEIYLSDPRKANPATMRTILRHPVRNGKTL
jgi:hypothetical protein